MKAKRLFPFFYVVISMITLTLPASARASDQLRDYWMNAGTSNGQIFVEFSVKGQRIMNRIGCENIVVYEDANGQWNKVASLDEDDSGMSGVNSRSFGNTIYIDGDNGRSYKVVVAIFAEDNNGRDSREETFYVVCKA